MKGLIVTIRNGIIRFFYVNLLKRILFLFDPERVHDWFNSIGDFLGRHAFTRWFTYVLFGYSNPILEQRRCGIDFKNPVGLAAGFDKNGHLVEIIPSVGFGFIEVGSITGEPCAGNPKPRLWRLVRSKSLAVYYGLKNDGCAKIAERLKTARRTIPLGVSIAKTNDPKLTSVDGIVKDYVKSFRKLADIGDYITLNLSCPNVCSGSGLINAKLAEKVLIGIRKFRTEKPVFMKISPDIDKKEVDELIETAFKHKIDGFVCTNLTKNRSNPKIIDKNVPAVGGLSGKVVEGLSNKMLEYAYKRSKGKLTLIGCGGIFTAEDAYKKIRLGASLVQVITGMIYNGPQSISEINQGVVRLLKRDGFRNVSEAVGVDAR